MSTDAPAPDAALIDPKRMDEAALAFCQLLNPILDKRKFAKQGPNENLYFALCDWLASRLPKKQPTPEA